MKLSLSQHAEIAHQIYPAVKGFSLEQVFNFITYLYKYGYFNTLSKKLFSELKIEDIIELIKKLQAFAGLNPSGELDDKTMRIMIWPRCSNPDFLPLEEEHLTGDTSWGTKYLKYYIAQRDRDLSPTDWDAGIKTAFQNISNICGLSFTQVDNKQEANLVLGIGSGSQDQFDSAGGVLAWYQLPPRRGYTGQLQGKFDSAETWVLNPQERGILLVNVACHEIIHGLGLQHSRVQGALMAPYYNPSVSKPQVNDDIARLQSLYGPPNNNPTEPPVTPPTPNSTKITISGNVSSIQIDGYRVQKIS